MKKNNNNIVALVTGGTTGIGKSIALKLAKNGIQVISNYIVLDKNDKKELELANVHLEKFDVSLFNETEAAINRIKKKFKRIDVLVNNAGIIRDGFFHKSNEEQWKSVISVNLMSVFNCTKCVIDDMRNNNYGRIINLSSVNALKGQIGQTNYCAAKAGIIGFSKALAQENAKKNVTVNCIAPGYVKTKMTADLDADVMSQDILPLIPMNRLAEPSEIADMVVFLILKGGYITGQVLSVNGGLFM